MSFLLCTLKLLLYIYGFIIILFFRDDEFNFQLLSDGDILLPMIYFYQVIATVDEGYNIVFVNSTADSNSTDSNSNSNNSSSTQSPFKTNAGIFVYMKGYYDTQFSAPILLYQSSQDNYTLKYFNCEVSSSGIGQVCMITTILSNSTNTTSYYAKLHYLTSGAVIKISPILSEANRTVTDFSFNLISIPFGGYLYTNYSYENNVTSVYGLIYDRSVDNSRDWDLPQPSIINSRRHVKILPNNTLLLAKPESNNSWSFVTVDLPGILVDHGYSNVHINTTFPRIDDNIPTFTDKITITYNEPVELSTGNISIYQFGDSGSVLRQYVSGIDGNGFCSISDDGLIVTIDVIKSTFSKPLGKFYVKTDNNFVRNKAYKEPLIGIYENIWKFNTCR